MKRALSQPLLWIRSPSRDRSTTAEQMILPIGKPSVHWEDRSGSENEDSPRLARARGKSTLGMRARRFSLLSSSPNVKTEVERPAGGLEIGSFIMNGSADSVHRVSTTTSSQLEKHAIQYSALFPGRGTTTCSKYLADNMQAHIADAIEKAPSPENYDAILAEAFKNCDASFTSEHPHDASGSCAVVSIMQDRTVHVAWAGEARALLCYGNDVRSNTWDHQPSNESERKRILSHGGLVTGGQILGVLSASRGFGENDVKSHFSDGVFIARPSVVTWKVEDEASSMAASPGNHSSGTRPRFLILASQSVFSVLTNDVACKLVNRTLHHYDNNPTTAAEKLVKYAFKKCHKECSAVVIVWGEPMPRSRSSSLASWRSLRSFSTHDTDDEGNASHALTPSPSLPPT